MKKKTLVLLSGGLDSTTCLALAVKEYGKDAVIALASRYGQKHIKELESARKVAEWYGVELKEIDLSEIYKGCECSLIAESGKEIEKTSYKEQTDRAAGKPVSTYVPFRNGLFISVAASIAISCGAANIWYGAHRDDAAGAAYPDCSQEFMDSMNRAIYEGSGRQVTLVAPFIDKTKADIVKAGLEISVPYKITWSCYEGGEKPCGKCGTCRDRRKAFEKNGVKDPLEVEENV